ncbi:hypothetical protein [Lacticaseibacillus songhuajiangensis]|uniref:hypothetical protein n=1 Tax=Lacticaseibacillus songhuajiangensis TaxID=1296539 RepID=UPI000F7823CD|nr:hypothetical protein [Lacticaseibacillus songhuajiangensis]
MTPNEEWVKHFVEQNGRMPEKAEYAAAKKSGFRTSGISASLDEDTDGDQDKLATSRKTKRHLSRKRVLLISVAIVSLITVIGIAIVITRGQTDHNSTNDISSLQVKSHAKSKKSARNLLTVSDLSQEQKLALVLLADGMDDYMVTGNEILDGGYDESSGEYVEIKDPEVATDNPQLVSDHPDGMKVYSLSLTHIDQGPIVAIKGATAWVVSAQQAITMDYFASNGKKLDLTKLLKKFAKSSKFKEVTAKITVEKADDANSNSESSSVSEESESSESADNASPKLDISGLSGEYLEDASTANSSGKMTSEFRMDGDDLRWISNKADGETAYSAIVDSVTDDGKADDGEAYTLECTLDDDTEFQMQLFKHSLDYYVIRIQSDGINYYGRFNQE